MRWHGSLFKRNKKKTVFKIYGYTLFTAIFTKGGGGGNFYDFLFVEELTFKGRKRKKMKCSRTAGHESLTMYSSRKYRIYRAIRRGFCPSRMTSNN